MIYSSEDTGFILINRTEAIITSFIAHFTALSCILSYTRRKRFPKGISFPFRRGSLKTGITIPNTNPYS